MSGWAAVLGACAVCYLLKLVGYLLPTRWLRDERIATGASLVTAGLLAALVVVQTVADGPALTLDARLAAVATAAFALWLRAPFVLVVLLGAISAAGVRSVT